MRANARIATANEREENTHISINACDLFVSLKKKEEQRKNQQQPQQAP